MPYNKSFIDQASSVKMAGRHFGRPTGDDLGCLFFGGGGGGLGNPGTDHRSKISWITVHQRNRRILSQSGFIGSFDIL